MDRQLLQEELETFEQCKDALLGEHENEYAVVRGSELLGTFVSEIDAVNAAYGAFGNVPFLVKKIERIELPLNFVSHHIAL
jgi:hypothetical protein